MKDPFDITQGLFSLTAGTRTPAVVVPTKPLAWVTKPPATGKAGQDITGAWEGGVPPYDAEVRSAAIVLNNYTGPLTTITVNADGTNQGAGLYTWTVTDKNGASITATTQIDLPAIVISKNLSQSLALTDREQLSLEVTATGGVGKLHYQWTKDGVNIGGDKPTYGPTNAPTVGTHRYRVKITDSANQTVLSTECVVTVSKAVERVESKTPPAPVYIGVEEWLREMATYPGFTGNPATDTGYADNFNKYIKDNFTFEIPTGQALTLSASGEQIQANAGTAAGTALHFIAHPVTDPTVSYTINVIATAAP